MLENIWFIAAAWMGLALIASLISIRIGISVALIEILVGVLAGNLAIGLEGGTLHTSASQERARAPDTCITYCNRLSGRTFSPYSVAACSRFSRERKSIPSPLKPIGAPVCG